MIGEIWHKLNSFEFMTPDPLVKKLFFFAPPFKILLVNVVYLAFVYKIGPALMRNREPFNLKKILLVYNLLQILLNLYVPICGYIMIIHHHFYEIGCMIALPADHSHKYMELSCFYVYYLIKFIDFMDTVFFVLRKSTRQITFLHVYHHVMMANICYVYTRYNGVGGHIGIMGILNSIVHVFMYFYYLMSAVKPSVRESIWWKKYITRFQIIQFLLIFVHNLYPLIYRPDCRSPKIMNYCAILQSILMLYMFGTFYINAYIKNGDKKLKARKSENGVDKNGIEQNGKKTKLN